MKLLWHNYKVKRNLIHLFGEQNPDFITMSVNSIIQFLGIQTFRVGHTEKLISGLGAFISIFVILYLDSHLLTNASAYLIVASMGASAALLFAVPHGPLSQPWALIGGHVLSAIIGVSCAKMVPDAFLAASLAVGLSVTTMYYANCIHPPGGATALSAVIGSNTIHDLGYQFVLTPVLLNVIIIISVAILFNALFKWRRYPSVLASKPSTDDLKNISNTPHGPISHEDFVYALSQFDSFIDISEEDLLAIYDLVTKNQNNKSQQANK